MSGSGRRERQRRKTGEEVAGQRAGGGEGRGKVWVSNWEDDNRERTLGEDGRVALGVYG